MPHSQDQPENPPEDELIEAGTEIVGEVAGTGIGLIVAGPVGALFGAVAGPIITRSVHTVALEFKQRLMAPRELARIGGTLAFAKEKIKQNIASGLSLRNDDFFTRSNNGRSDADEIVEGILIAAQRDYEERKIPFYGKLIGNIAFHPEIDRYYANLLIRVSRDLSYRQFCLLSLLSRPSMWRINLSHIGDGDGDPKKQELIMEIYDLHRKGLINPIMFYGFRIEPETSTEYDEIKGVGKTLINLMELQIINQNDIDDILAILGIQFG